ncbi:hypothetical protein CASFOL_020009 [Castilleja foliolosa]|uniref:TOD1/MUCI70 glycosyltransferase-like domain-containing protein n=1 Tax=Castilleja foliolosa TaxID=1961234 RepID=A0ABD3D3T7_9LAMI
MNLITSLEELKTSSPDARNLKLLKIGLYHVRQSEAEQLKFIIYPKRRRCRINEKLKALQSLVPNSNKNISEYTQKNVCFHMFVDEETNFFLRNSNALDGDEKVGIWRIIVVHNLPYSDRRRNEKIPKLLPHWIFPNAPYSMWINAKLELIVDPFQILERFLWRKNASFAISRHYKRFDSEAEANKAAGKYNNASIDFQTFEKDGYHRDLLDHLPPDDNTHVILNDDDNLNKTIPDGLLADIITNSSAITKGPTKHI